MHERAEAVVLRPYIDDDLFDDFAVGELNVGAVPLASTL